MNDQRTVAADSAALRGGVQFDPPLLVLEDEIGLMPAALEDGRHRCPDSWYVRASKIGKRITTV